MSTLNNYIKFHNRQSRKWAKVLEVELNRQLEQYIATDLLFLPFDGIARIIKELYKEAALIYGWNTFKQFRNVKAPIDFTGELEAFIEQYFKLYLLNKAVIPINDYTKEIMLKYITEGKKNGDAYDVIAKKIIESGINSVRATRIARTEVAKAANVGGSFGAKKTGLKMQKTWLSAMDKRTRFDHANMNGITVGIDENFSVGGEPMQHPCDPDASGANVINCRCTVAYRPLRDSNGRAVRENNFGYIQF